MITKIVIKRRRIINTDKHNMSLPFVCAVASFFCEHVFVCIFKHTKYIYVQQ